MDVATASLAMQRAAMGPEASLMMLKQAAEQQQAVLQIVQSAQQNLPPPSDPARGTQIDILA